VCLLSRNFIFGRFFIASIILTIMLSSTIIAGTLTKDASATATLPRTNIAMTKQTDEVLTALSVGRDGSLRVSWVVGTGKWNGPAPISPPNFAPPGAAIAMAKQTANTLTALIVGNNGALHVSWVDGTGKWNGPAPISPPNMFPAGAGIGMSKQTNDILTALTVGNNGALHVSWVVGTGKWNGPAPISRPDFAAPGSPIAMTKQTANTLTALTVGDTGNGDALHVSWVDGTGRWNGPAQISPPGLYPPSGTGIAMTKQTANTLLL
jgi:hypothetical protein